MYIIYLFAKKANCFYNICKNRRILFLVVIGGLVHGRPLHLPQFSDELLMLSHEHRLYLVPQPCLFGPVHIHCR